MTFICPSLQSFIYLFSKCLWSAWCVLAIVLRTEERMYGKQTKAKSIAKKTKFLFSSFEEMYILVGISNNEQVGK